MDDGWMWFGEWMGGWIDVVWRMDAWMEVVLENGEIDKQTNKHE